MEKTREMYEAFNATCIAKGVCTADVEASISTTKNDYSSLLQNDSLSRMEMTCNDIVPGSTLCLVTNNILKEGIRTLEINKPVCFPPSCNEKDSDHVRFLDPNPTNCDNSCEIESTIVSCPPMRNENFDSETCQKNADSIISSRRYDRFISTLRSGVIRGCVSVLLGGESPFCEITTPLSVTSTRNFAGYDSTTSSEYQLFQETCFSTKSSTSVCRVSTHIKAIESDSFIDIETDFHYTEYPMCLPSDCANEDPTLIVKKKLVNGAFNCEAENSVCEIDVSDFTCEDPPPFVLFSKSFTSPSPSANPIKGSTTASPTAIQQSSMKMSFVPTILDSVMPTIVESFAPSALVQTEEESLPPTDVLKSLLPGIETSLSPSITTETNIISVIESIVTPTTSPTLPLSSSAVRIYVPSILLSSIVLMTSIIFCYDMAQ